MKAAVITPVGPGHADLYRHCVQSVERAKAAGLGAFQHIELIAIDDTRGELGRSRARNMAVRQAAEAGVDWIFFLDADDLMHAKCFIEAAPHLATHDALWGLIVEQTRDGRVDLRLPQVPTITGLHQLLLFDPYETIQMGHWVRTGVAVANPFDEAMDAGEDVDYYLRLWRTVRCSKVANIFFLNRRGQHSTGPRSATGGQWRVTVDRMMAEAREAAGLNHETLETVSLRNGYAQDLARLMSDLGRSVAPSQVADLARHIPYRGLFEVSQFGGGSFLMLSDGDDLTVAALIWNARCEAPVATLWQSAARFAAGSLPGDASDRPGIIDVGAYTGFYSLLAARARPGAVVVGIEPDASSFLRLQQNLRRNGVAAAGLRAVARDCPGEIDIAPPRTHDSPIPGGPDAAGEMQKVAAIRLDDLVDGMNVATKLIRLNLEGGELAALEGLSRTIARDQPDLLLRVRALANAAEITRLVTAQGYRLFALNELDGTLQPQPVLAAPGQVHRHFFLTTRPDAELKALLSAAGDPPPAAAAAASAQAPAARPGPGAATVGHLFRSDPTNVGDWYCAPGRYFAFDNGAAADILSFDPEALSPTVVVGGGGIVAPFFHPHMQRLVSHRHKIRHLVGWGFGESEHVEVKARFAAPYDGELPDYLKAFDLVGIRDFGTDYRWVPCASCMLPAFDQPHESRTPIGIYQHKRVPIDIDGFPRMTNDGNDIDAAIRFLGSCDVVITNSYHGAYWATLLGKRVLCLPFSSKFYRLKHLPTLCRPEEWKRYLDLTRTYPNALAECRAANNAFYTDVVALTGIGASKPGR